MDFEGGDKAPAVRLLTGKRAEKQEAREQEHVFGNY
jgi:hypothetical protein